MTEKLAPIVYASAVEAGRAGEGYSEAFNAGVLGCLEGRLDGIMPLDCPYMVGTKEHADFQAGVAEGRDLSPVGKAPFGFADEVSDDED